MIRATGSKAESRGPYERPAPPQRFRGPSGTGLPDAGVGYVMLFNILHAEEPQRLLREAYRILMPGGTAAVMHWTRDHPTPRGPSAGHPPKPGGLPDVDDGEGFPG